MPCIKLFAPGMLEMIRHPGFFAAFDVTMFPILNHTKVSYTIETPKPFPIEARVKSHFAAVETLMNALKERSMGR